MFFAGSKYLILVQGQQWEIWQFACVSMANFENIQLVNPKWICIPGNIYLLKVNNIDCILSFVDFEQVNVSLVIDI